ncbi:MAG: hypothetical protein RDV41_00285 [Planctomycetota bacterium]|nr:hypothetical protein [Planctomycetota bacterium]
MDKARGVLGAIIVVVIIIVAVFFGSKTDKAVAYNDKIVAQQARIVKAMTDVFNADDPSVMGQRLDAAIPVIDDAIKTVKAMDAFEGNTELRDTAVKLFEFYKSIGDVDYREMIEIGKKGPEPSEEDQKRMMAIQEDVSQREEVLDAEMERVQAAFASKHDFQLKPTELPR